MAPTQVQPRGTSWGSVLGGWLAALGALTLVFPAAALLAAISPAAQARIDDPTLAVPLVLAIFIAWLIGGYVAGRMAGYRRSWHGLMSAIWGLFVALLAGLIAVTGTWLFAGSLPTIDISAYGNATVFGFVLGMVGFILGGWLGGLLSPAPVMRVGEPVRERVVERPAPVLERSRLRDPSSREPTFEEQMTGRAPEAAGLREKEKEALVPPAQHRGSPEGDGETRRVEDTEVRH